MQLFSTVLLSISLAVATLGAPAPLINVQRFNGETTGKQLVKFKQGISLTNWVARLNLTSEAEQWNNLNGFAANLDTDALDILRSSKDVEWITEDGIMHTFASVTQNDAPWGLQRISQNGKLGNRNVNALNFVYRFDNTSGAGVDIFVVDTGINTAHVEFGGRARFGASFGSVGNNDGNGHGTHCAGTAGGDRFGIAKKANLIAVKVLSDSGSGASSGIVSGLNFVLSQAAASRRPSVVTMSLGGGVARAIDDAVAVLTKAGIHVVVAAGNDNVDAANTSPARSPSAITVGASTINDSRASFSNFGGNVDIFAPGQGVVSAFIGSTTATQSLSGTSMSTPHVAGLVAYLIGKDGNIPPAAMQAKIQKLSVKNALSGIPGGTTNFLARNT